MRDLKAILAIFALLLVGFCCDGAELKNEKSVVVVGVGECKDCVERNIRKSNAFSGLLVTIDCKVANGNFKMRGSNELDEGGKFHVKLPNEIVNNEGKLIEQCYAQLHSASHNPCTAQNGLETSKLVLKSKAGQKHTFGIGGKLEFTSETCTSKFLWPHLKSPRLHKLPSFPKIFPLHKNLPKVHLPPFKSFHFPPKVPFYKPRPTHIYPKPLPPPIPIYKPKPPVYKKPFPPIYIKPLPPLTKLPPIYIKPLPPLPKLPPISIKPLPPLPKLPFPHKPLPSLPKLPSFPHKPLPPLPKLPLFPKKPLNPFHYLPPLPPFSAHPFYKPKYPISTPSKEATQNP